MNDLFDTRDFPARWHCGQWSSTHGWVHIISDLLIFAAYFTIPLILAYFILRRKDLPFPRVFMLFVLFIASCGLTHLVEASIFWWPAYRFSGLLKAITAAASWLTVIALIPIIPKALRLPGLARMNDDLTAEIRHRREAEESLLTTSRALARSNHDLEQFAYVASHDLQEPLRKIQSYSSILAEDSTDLQTEDREHIARIVESAGRMRRLIDDLLSYSRLETTPATAQSIDLDRTMHDVVDDLSETIRECQADVTWSDMPTIFGVPTQIRQLLTNLLSNALKFRATDRAPVIRIQASQDVDSWVIRFQDNGIGIDTTHSARIFEPFQRLHNQREFPGNGIGLSICQRIVQGHGGSIELTSEVGAGSTFTVYLPATKNHS